jgi:hypothetical protein
MEVRDQSVEALPSAKVDDVRHDGPVDQRDHRLGDLVRERAQASAEPRRKDHGLHAAGEASGPR